MDGRSGTTGGRRLTTDGREETIGGRKTTDRREETTGGRKTTTDGRKARTLNTSSTLDEKASQVTITPRIVHETVITELGLVFPDYKTIKRPRFNYGLAWRALTASLMTGL